MREPRSVVITGASRGLGLASATLLYKQGWRVVGAMRSPEVGLERLRAATGAHADDSRLIGVRLDLDDPSSITATAKAIEDAVGAPNALVHNAGIAAVGCVEDMPFEVWERLFRTNLFGPVRLTKELLPSMRAAGRGRIVVVSSQGGIRGMPSISAYSAAKGALERWAEALAEEIAPFGLSVTILVSGMFKTDILTEQTPHYGDLIGPYATHYAGIERTGRSMMRLANPPERFGPALARALDERAPFARRTVGIDARMLLVGSRLLPGRLLHDAVRWAMRLPRHGAIQGRLRSRPPGPAFSNSPSEKASSMADEPKVRFESPMLIDGYEPFSEAVREDPYPYYAALRDEAPVYWAERAQAWCVSRYDDVQFVLRNAELFSSDAMRTMLMGAPPGVNPLEDPDVMERALTLTQALAFPMEELISARNLLSEDPPRHTAMRNLVNRGFTPRRIAMWEPRVREFTRACVNEMRHAEEIDLVAALAMPLPVRVICEILGVESERRDDFKQWSDRIIAATTGSTRMVDPLTSGFAEAMKELAEYIRGVVAQRTKQPSDDLISVLLAAQDDGAGLSAAEMTMFVLLLLVAGNETTTNLIGNATNALLSHPSQLARVSADRSLVPSWIEETLRWDSPVQFVSRRTTDDVEVAGQRLPANAHVVAIIGSANRDERHWGPTAAQFDVTRNPQGHLAFGFGNHFCLGASLARLEARVALEALLDELPRRERSEARVEHIDSFLIRGPKRFLLRSRRDRERPSPAEF